MDLPLSCHRSEKRLLPHPPCAHCGRPKRPVWREASGLFEDSLDPIGTVTYICPTVLCSGSDGY